MVSDIRRKIKKAIAEDGTVLFVGAGISTCFQYRLLHR